jgi:tetratricopeptide (TPR) repeat protein
VVDLTNKVSEKVAETVRRLLEREWNAEAERLLKDALELQPDAIELVELLAETMARQGRLVEALSVLLHALERFPGDVDLRIRLGQFVAVEGQRVALELFRSTEDVEITSPLVQVEVGMTLADMGQFDEAEVAIKKALKDEPEYMEAWLELAHIRIETGDWQGSIRPLRMALQSGGPPADIHVDLAAAFLHLGFVGEADRVLVEAAAAGLEHAGLAYYGAARAAMNNDTEAAVTALKQAFTNDPDRLRRLFQVDRFFDTIRDLPEVQAVVGSQSKEGVLMSFRPRKGR